MTNTKIYDLKTHYMYLRLNLASVVRIVDKENIVINKFKAVMKNNKIIKRFNFSKNLSKK